MQLSRTLSTLMIPVMLLSLGACSQEVSQNIDGSLKLETALNESAVLDMLDIALADTTIDVEELYLHQGYVLVHGDCDMGGGEVHPIEIRLEFDAEDGGLVTRITEASVQDQLVSPGLISTWNAAIAARRVENGAGNRGRELTLVTVTPNEVSFTWRVERLATPEE